MTMARPQVSVMMPARNAEATIGAALSSALVPSSVDLQVVVVNDASTDGTVDVVKSLGDRRIVLVDGPGLGVNAARNVALKVMTGDWLTLLDADDLWLPNRLDILLEQAQQWQAPIIADDLLVEPDDSSRPYSLLHSRGLRHRAPCMVSAADFARLEFGWLQPLARADVIGDLRFWEHIRKAGDFPFWFQAIKRAGGLWLAPQVGYRYRYRQAESVSAESPALWLQGVASTAELLGLPNVDLTAAEKSALERRVWLAWARYHRELAFQSWRDGDTAAVAKRALTNPSIIGERVRGAAAHLVWWGRRLQAPHWQSQQPAAVTPPETKGYPRRNGWS